MVSYSLEHECCRFSHSVIGLLTYDDCSFRYTPTLFYRQSLPAKLQSFLTPWAIVVPVWTDHFKKPSVTVDSIVHPRTHFVGILKEILMVLQILTDICGMEGNVNHESLLDLRFTCL